MSANPTNLAAETAKTVDDGSGNTKLLQSSDRVAHIADVATTGTYATDDDSIVAAINGLRDALITAGIMKAS